MAGQFEKLPNPSVLPSGTAYYISFGGGSEFLVMPSVIYRCQGNKLTKIGGTVPNSGWGSAISKNGQYVATVNGSSVYLYKHDGNGNLQELSFTKPTGGCRSPSFSLDNNYFAVGITDATANVAIYKRSGDTFTKLTPIGAIPDGYGRATAWSSCGNYLAVGTYSNDVAIYKRSGDVFTRLATPTVKPTGYINGCSFSRNADYLAYSHNGSPYITIYKRSGDTFTKLANPVSLPENRCYGCAFSPGGRYLAVAAELAGKSVVYERSGDTFTKIKTFSDAVYARGVGFSGDGKYLVFGNTNEMSIYSGSMEVLDLQRFLLKSGGYTTIVGGAVKALPETTLSSALFEREGFADLGSVLPVLPNLDRQFELLVYDTEAANTGIKLDHLPHPQLMVFKEPIALPEGFGISGVALTIAGTTGMAKVVLSFDDGGSWQTFLDGAWAEIALDKDIIKAKGLTASALNGITKDQWQEVSGQRVNFAFYLEKSAVNNDLAVDSLTITVNRRSHWERAEHEVDYDYGYPSSKTLLVKLLKDGSYKMNYADIG